MTLNQLYCFRMAAEILNFHRAAEKLMISQPSLSASVAGLERELGAALFQRRGRHVELTKQGQIYYMEVNGILERLDTINELMRRAGTPGRGHIDLGFIAPLSSRFIPSLVREFIEETGYDEITFSFRELLTQELLAGLRNFRNDVVFGIYEENIPDVEFVPIIRQELVGIVSRQNPLADLDREIELRELSPYPFITYMPHTRLYGEIMRYIREDGWEPKVLCDSTTEASIAGLVENNFGVSVTALSPAIKSSRVKILHLKGDYYRQIYMAYQKREEVLPSVREFIRFVKRKYTGTAGLLIMEPDFVNGGFCRK